jgi:hypothetical protein
MNLGGFKLNETGLKWLFYTAKCQKITEVFLKIAGKPVNHTCSSSFPSTSDHERAVEREFQ